ncbi:YihY/virulence factor BrkB family protein [Rhizosphaericola mali]|uniref:YihY/virulence factor BrkB family protein n=1 Tax=Rhizosphaericola mali TaxID=2545455 RepID=A0A5P2G4J1_9BACT|nr:YihY/virulence factor BrkB family protein [Rhizosphaericola mali]QES90744.1 YihY/virulence factor BrkB family protein [Rhizosphaericola mali]
MTNLERLLLNSTPACIIRKKLQGIVLPGFLGLPLYDVYRYFLNTIRKEGLSIRSAAMSFNILLAIPAVFLFICSLLPYLPISRQIFNALANLLYDLTPDRNTRRILRHFLDDLFNKQKNGLLSLGFILTLFYSSNAVMGIIRAFDKSVSKKLKTNFIKKRWRAIKLLLLLILLLLGNLLISMTQGALFNKVMTWLHIKSPEIKALVKSLRWIVIFFLFLFSISFLYKYAPTIKRTKRLITPGAIIGTVLIILCTSVFSYWAQNISNYSKFYGSIGSVMIIMLLIFFNSMMLLIGFEIDMSIRNVKEMHQQAIKNGVY